MNASAGMDLIRSFFSSIDTAIYSLISILYRLLLQLASTSIFTTADIESFASRVYVFLGIIMLFKVTFSLINYLVNPDAITDKTNGAGNVAKNIVITLFLIIIVPYAFDLLYNAQSAILNDNLIPRLILGTTDGDTDSQNIVIDSKICLTDDGQNYKTSVINDVGDYIALVAFKPFFQSYNDDSVDYHDPSKVAPGTIDSFCNSSTVKQMLLHHNADTAALNTGKYVFDYSFFLSTITGVLVLLLLLEFCFDVAMRCVKLGFLEIIAPIPIISYIDPNSGKNGMFKKWTKEVINTWARLFIRLVILFFAIYAITIINNNLGTVANTEHGMWIMLFLVIGALLFAKKAVQLIEDILGIKFDHSIQLNPFKKISDQALGGKQLLGAAAGATALTASAIGSGVSHAIARNKGKQQLADAQNKAEIERTKQRLNRDLYLRQSQELNALERRRREADQRVMAASDAKSLARAIGAYDRIQTQIDAKKAEIDATKLRGREIKSDLDKREEELAVQQSKFDNSRLQNNLLGGYAEEIIHGAVNGAREGYKKPGHILKDVADSIQGASSQRNYREEYSIKDQILDKYTDIVGIRNDSGTTSTVKKEIKEATDKLNDINRSIEMLNRTISQINANRPGAISIGTDGVLSIGTTYSGSDRDEINRTIEEYNKLIKAKIAQEKVIKDKENIQKIGVPGSSKK